MISDPSTAAWLNRLSLGSRIDQPQKSAYLLRAFIASAATVQTSLHLAETLRPTALPHDSALHLKIMWKLLLSVRLGTSGDRRWGHQVGRRHSVLCFSPHDACTAVCFQKLCILTGKGIPCFGRIRFSDLTLKPRLAEHTHTNCQFFFSWM